MNQIEVGDPAASSLSSCLRAFRGGFSLLTETGLLRPFLVSNVNDVTSQQGGSAAAETPVVAAATPVCLSKPSPGGSFPAGADVPVDHAWSQDGELLVVLRRSSYTAYARELDPSSLPRQRRPSADQGAEDASSRAEASPRTRPDDAAAAAPSLGLVEAHVGSNSLFDGKVVACCMLDPSTAAAGGSVCSGEGSKGGGGSSGQTYLIAVGGASGVECHALELGRREGFGGSAERERTGDATEDEGKPTTVVPVLALGASCRPLNNVFQGYPVVAVAFSPDSGVMAAAAMTGHVKVWEVDALAAPAPPAQQVARQARSSGGVAARKGPAPRGGRGGGKKKGFDKAFCGTRSRPGRAESSDLPALWGVALPMARATSLSFAPDDEATFALACWDGKVALFLPTTAEEAGVSSPLGPWLSETPKENTEESGGGGGGRRSWKQVWRKAAAPADPIKKRGGGSLEDQDGAFLCWCKGPAAGSGSDILAAAAGLAVTAYGVKTGDCRPRQRRCQGEEKQQDRGDRTSPSEGGAMPYPITQERSPPCAPHAPFPPAAVTGPGFELFAGHGLGERVGGTVLRSRAAGLTPEPTAERYLVHGLAEGPGFVALYDSDLCLHVVSLAAILGAGRVLQPPALFLPPPRPAADAAAAAGSAGTFFSTVEAAAGDSSPRAGAVGAEASTVLLVERVKLASNDHGLVAACVRRHRGPKGDGPGRIAQPEDGLELLMTWRNATSGLETPDTGECVGEGSGGDGRRLPFLPGELADDDGSADCGNDGVFGADVRRGRLALFTRYSVLVYTRPGEGEAAGDAQGAEDGKGVAARPAGGWSAYADAPVLHGLLLGGASTASPLSQRLPEPPADLTNIYLLTILGTAAGGEDGGRGAVLSIRSLGDRSVSCRCPLTSATADGDDDGHEKAAVLAENKRGMKVYASPGYGGGVFAVAAERRPGECARVWRGTFDEGTSRLEVGPCRVITSYPWPEPETLRLQGVAGPNCELFLFKQEQRGSKSDPGAKAGGKGNVRWWMTWPEAEIWRWVDAPVLLGDEDLGVSEFVKIFQVEVEEMISSYPLPEANDD